MAVTISGSGVVTGLDSEASSDLGSKLDTAGGLVMVTPTTIANSGGTASLTNGAVSFSGVTSVSLNGVFTSAYDNYRIVGNITGSTVYTITMRMRAAGTDNTANNYSFGVFFVNTTGGTGSTASNTLQNGWTQNYGGTSRSHFSTDIYSPAITSQTGYFTTSNNNENGTIGYPGFFGGSTSVTTQYDGITFFNVTGTLTGTIRVYGYRNGI